MKSIKTRLLLAALLIGLTAVLAGCGKRLIRGEPPFVQIYALKTGNEAVSLDMGIRNVNDVELQISHFDFVIMLKETELTRFNAPRDALVIASGSEMLRFELAANKAGMDLLESLQDSEISSLPYTLEGSIHAPDDGMLEFSGEGHLYPVPGRPGQFR